MYVCIVFGVPEPKELHSETKDTSAILGSLFTCLSILKYGFDFAEIFALKIENSKISFALS